MRLRRSNLRFAICNFRAAHQSSNRSGASPSPRSGVALIVTIIMISVITFLTIAFLALSGREKGSVKSATNQTTARLSADQALDRAKVELLTGILASRNPNNFDLLVSTNFINWPGFDPTAVDGLTNVNYTYANGNPLNNADRLLNLANLLYDPRPPVFITNRLAANSQDFRYYRDMNRNGQYDRSGYGPVTNILAGNPFAVVGTNGLFVSNYFVGDPEWIGALERPGLPHSATNKFTHRYAYIAIPAGKTLDVNYIHNQTLAALGGAMDPNGANFFRNQGIGGWELNLAGFLYDLNTNDFHGWGGPYVYNPFTGFPTAGNAFADAAAIYRYRVNGAPNVLNYALPSVAGLYGPNGGNAFQTDMMDGYSSRLPAPFSTNGLSFVSAGYLTDTDNPSLPWVGANHAQAIFTTQDLFDRAKTSKGVVGFDFADRLEMASTNVSTYDRYTYYRLLSQLGTDSAPEDSDKMNLNYVNVGGYPVTNYLRWADTNAVQAAFPGVSASVLFFTNAADRLLREYSANWLASDYGVYTNIFRNDLTFGVTNIPVLVSNQFVYSPAVHRLLQVAANLWDAKPNGRTERGLPTVFRPRFVVRGENIYISDFVEESTFGSIAANTSGRVIIDILATNNPAASIPADGNVLIFGVPPVVGARKGLPNFNEFQIETIFSITRKIQLRRSGGVIDQTNQFYTMSLAMPSAAEFWNSYAANYFPAGGVIVSITNRTTFTMTNDLGINFTRTFVTGDRFTTNNAWPRYRQGESKSLITLMRTNVPFLPTIGYVPGSGFVNATNENSYDVSQNLLMPRWGITISNRVHAMILRQGTDEIIDYVLLGNMVYSTNLTEIIIDPASGTGNAFERLWATNTYPGNPNLLSGRAGIEQQINISLGSENIPPPENEWRQYGNFAPSSPENEITYFRNRYFSASSNGLFNVPFTPTVQFRVPMIWQANDPLVHYNANDLYYQDVSDKVIPIKPPAVITAGVLENIGQVNQRYQPWKLDTDAAVSGGNARDLTLKDSLVTSSDEWQFPTNYLPTVGWLGRIHRGTPWQTVYLKAYDVGGLTNRVNSPTEWVDNVVFRPAAENWARWSGNRILQEGFYSRPVTDRILFDVFTTAVNDNATRGRLPINQSGLAAWSALFSGMVALTNADTDRILAKPIYRPTIIEPAGVYDALDSDTWPALVRLVEGINRTRTNLTLFPNGTFNSLGDILATPELTVASPFLNVKGRFIPIRAIPDTAYEWLPQQMMSLVQLGEPRFVVYAYGQALQPAPDSILVGGTYSGLCTNYAITAEVAARAVVRIEGSPDPTQTSTNLPPQKRYPPRIVVESYNLLPPD
jgi:hypothetical protein